MKAALLKYYCLDHYVNEDDYMNKFIFTEYSGFEEVSGSDFSILQQWIYNKNSGVAGYKYMLITDSDIPIKVAIAEQLKFIQKEKERRIKEEQQRILQEEQKKQKRLLKKKKKTEEEERKLLSTLLTKYDHSPA